MLRKTLLGAGLLALAGALVAALRGAPFPLVMWLGVLGLALIGGILLERGRYKPTQSGGHPGPDWVATGERFVDPDSGETVTVFYRPATGERRYVGRDPAYPVGGATASSARPRASGPTCVTATAAIATATAIAMNTAETP